MKKLFLYLGIFLFFASCKKNETKPSLSSDAAINEKVTQLYVFNKSNDRYSLPKDLFTHEIEELLKESEKITAADTEKIKKSDHPTDMPMMLVTSLMTNLQDADTGFKIKKTTVKGNTAEVLTEFQYNYDKSNKSSIEIKVLLINENGWKVSNIVYDKNANSNLKATLQSFIKQAKEQNK